MARTETERDKERERQRERGSEIKGERDRERHGEDREGERDVPELMKKNVMNPQWLRECGASSLHLHPLISQRASGRGRIHDNRNHLL